MGFGLKCADGSRDGAHGGLQPVANQFSEVPDATSRRRVWVEGLGKGHQGNGVVAASVNVRTQAGLPAARRDWGDPSARSPQSPRG
jgi:hypothetical protein